MSVKLSRRQLARYVAERLLKGDDSVVDELASLLIEEGRQRELKLIVRDIETYLAEAGEVVVTVEVARELDAGTRSQIEQMFAGKKVHINQVLAPELIGGCRIITPTQMLDASLAKQLTALKTAKI